MIDDQPHLRYFGKTVNKDKNLVFANDVVAGTFAHLGVLSPEAFEHQMKGMLLYHLSNTGAERLIACYATAWGY